jgi:hypothetical protein
MIRHKLFLVLSLLLVFIGASTARAAEPIKHRIMIAEYADQHRLVEIDREGKVTWEYAPPGLCVIFHPLANGNVVYAYGGNPTGVAEVNRDKKIVWNYVSKCPQVLGCEREANGSTLVGEQGPCRAVEVDPAGKVVATTPLICHSEAFHTQLRNLHKLPSGNILSAHEADSAIREVTPLGKLVWECDHVENTGEALRLPNGNTLIAGATSKRLFEVTPKGEIVWEFSAKDAPELNMTWIASLQILKNGHIVVGNFIRGSEGKGVHAFEVTRDKKIVWTFADHKLAKTITMVRVLDDE